MKTLLIMRHAKSSWKQEGMPDHDRPLNKRGQRDAPRMGRLLREHGLLPEIVFTSSARRARATAEAVAESAGLEGDVRVENGLYMAGPEAYVERLAGLPDAVAIALVVGHNPGLEELVEALTGQAETLPTGAIVHVRLPIERWADLDDGREGELVDVWRPRFLD